MREDLVKINVPLTGIYEYIPNHVRGLNGQGAGHRLKVDSRNRVTLPAGLAYVFQKRQAVRRPSDVVLYFCHSAPQAQDSVHSIAWTDAMEHLVQRPAAFYPASIGADNRLTGYGKLEMVLHQAGILPGEEIFFAGHRDFVGMYPATCLPLVRDMVLQGKHPGIDAKLLIP